MSLTRGMPHLYPSRLVSQLFFKLFFGAVWRTEHRLAACAPNGLLARCVLGGETGRNACLADREECVCSGMTRSRTGIDSARLTALSKAAKCVGLSVDR